MPLRRLFERWSPARRRAQAQVQEQLEHQLAADVLNTDEITRLHLAKLVLETDSEKRLRTIQALVQMRRSEAIAFVISELAQAGRDWPSDKASARLQFLSELFLQIASWPLEGVWNHAPEDAPTDLLRRTNALSSDMHSYLVALSLGVDTNQLLLPRFVAVRIYSSDASRRTTNELASRATEFCHSLGFVFADDFPASHGSWFKKWFARAKEDLSRDEVVERLKRAERAIELATLHKPQAAVDRDQAEAAARLIESMSNVSNAACQIGSLLVVKTTDSSGRSVVQARTLTADQMIGFERDMEMLKDPLKIFATPSPKLNE